MLAVIAIAAMLIGAFLLGAGASRIVRTSPPVRASDTSVRFTIGPPPGMGLDGALALSPDGRALVFAVKEATAFSGRSGRPRRVDGRRQSTGMAARRPRVVLSCGGRQDDERAGVASRPRLAFGTPTALFQTHAHPARLRNSYDVSPDGQTFLMNTALEDPATIPITVELNWTAALKK